MRFTNAKFVDTNVLVYAYDLSEPAKREKCLRILEKCWRGEIVLAVSNQVLAELFVVLTEKVERPLSKEDAKKIIGQIIEFNGFAKLNYGCQTVKSAAELSAKYKSKFWDSIIMATMIENSISEIYTENDKDFTIPGIRILKLV